MKKLLFAAVLALFSSGTALAQDADPVINILVTDNPMIQNDNNILQIAAANLDTGRIVANSLEIAITVPNNGNIRFVGLAPGSDPNWTVYSSTSERYILRNTGGGIGGFESQDIRLRILGFTASSNNSIMGTIAYIPGPNANLPGSAPSTIQGNDPNLTNDTSITTLTINPAIGLASQLVSFSGIARSCDALLSWKLASGTSTDRYELEKSTDGRVFLATDATATRSDADPTAYTALIAQPRVQMYYRLKITGADGHTTWSPTVRVLTRCEDRAVGVFPNPVRTQATVTGIASGDQIVLYNSIGQQVRATTSTSTQATLDLTGLAAGTYQVWIQGTGQSITLPLLKTE
jgi:hypothetical protein